MADVSNLPPPEMSAPMEKDCYAQVKVNNFGFTCTILNFNSFWKDSKKCQITSALPAGVDMNWHLKVTLNEEDKDYMSLSLIIFSCDKLEVNAKFEFSILNAKREVIKKHEAVRVYKFVKGVSIVSLCKNFLKRDEFLYYVDTGRLPDDKLMIFCAVSVIEDIIDISQQNAGAVQVLGCRLLDNLGLLFDDQKFCDVTFAVRGKEFQAHKVILAAQSPVFSAMFEHEMKERENNRVDITDMDPEVLKEMLRFIYTGKVANLKEMANDLFSAADKYGVESLKKMCEGALVQKLNLKNVTDFFILADLHCAPQLKAYVMDFIVTYAKDVMDTEGFESMTYSYPYLTKEILRAMVTPEQTTLKIDKEINAAQDKINQLRKLCRSRYIVDIDTKN